jgi:peptidoglycan hydrolase-like protein with peptidoglycan-binding domain
MAIPSSVINASVGLGGSNRHADVTLVQKLLNAVPSAKGGPLPALKVDGLCGPKTCGAIRQFQTTNKVAFADGRIDPGQKTEQALLALLAALGALSNLLAGLSANPVPAGPVPTPAAGPNSPIRMRFIAICHQRRCRRAPTRRETCGAAGTAAANRPAGVPARVPVNPLASQGVQGQAAWAARSFSPARSRSGEFVAGGRRPLARTWVPFAGNRPMPGDIYVPHKFETRACSSMSGSLSVLRAKTGHRTGQGNGWQSGFVRRRFQPSGQIDGEFGNKAVLRVNLDALFAWRLPRSRPTYETLEVIRASQLLFVSRHRNTSESIREPEFRDRCLTPVRVLGNGSRAADSIFGRDRCRPTPSAR